VKYKFSAAGMTEDVLNKFANYEDFLPKNTVLESEYYGHGSTIRRWCFYPQFFPIRMKITHGPSLMDVCAYHYLNSKEKYHAFFSTRINLDFKLKTKIKVGVTIKSPIAMLTPNKDFGNIEKRDDLYFLAHSTELVEIAHPVDTIVEFLSSEQEGGKKVGVMLHHVDVKKGLSKKFLNANIPTYCAGHYLNKDFLINFKEITSNYQNCVTNDIGSHVLYCYFLGLKINFQTKLIPLVLSNHDSNELLFEKNKDNIFLNYCRSAFEKNNGQRNAQLDYLVRQELGLVDGLSRIRLTALLYLSLFHWLFSNVSSFVCKKKTWLIEFFCYIYRKYLLGKR
jgi:hypothetical protein